MLGGFGAQYPKGDTTLKGIPFSIPSSGPNWWHGGTGTGGNPRILHVSVNRYGVSEIYTLINTYWGVSGDSTRAAVQFVGTKDTFTLALFTGKHIRDFDYLGPVYENKVDSGITTEVYNNGTGQRLDRQRLVLPSAFLTDTLKAIRFIDNGGSNVQRIFLYGLTISYCSGSVVRTRAPSQVPALRTTAAQGTYTPDGRVIRIHSRNVSYPGLKIFRDAENSSRKESRGRKEKPPPQLRKLRGRRMPTANGRRRFLPNRSLAHNGISH